MTFENIRIVDPYVEKGWTPEIKLTLATHAGVDALESKFGVSFPEGYREFVTTLGKGEYCGHNTAIRVDLPLAILAEYKEHQNFLDEFWFWDAAEDLLAKTKGVECIKVFDTDVGDVVVFHPSNPAELFCLPRDDDFSYNIGSTLLETFDWLVAKGSKGAGGTDESLKWRVFVPHNPFASTTGIIRPAFIDRRALWELIKSVTT